MVPYLAVVLIGFVAWLLFQARGIFGVIFSHARLDAGDYNGALRRVRWTSLGIPNVMCLHNQGLILSLGGRLTEAETRYRKAIGMLKSDSRYHRERLHACLGFVLMDQRRFSEAEQCFERAIAMGDVTGSSQDGLAELRLVRGVDAERALAYANQAIEHAKRRAKGLIAGAGSFYAHQAWALALLGRNEDARESLDEALRIPAPPAGGTAELRWRAGMVLLAMNQPAEARLHFQIGRDADPRGKYGRRCAERLQGAA
jgi:tetratricopeptide (TPR) repeat protein